MEDYQIGVCRGCRLLQLNRSTFSYKPKEKPDEEVLKMRIRDLAAVRVRFGYRRLTVLLQREGWHVNKRRVYRIYRAEGLEVRTKRRKKRAAEPWVGLPVAEAPSQRWSMDFMSDKLHNDQRFRILTVIDHFDRSCPVLYEDQSIGANKVIDALEAAERDGKRLPEAITIDNNPVPRNVATTKQSAHLLAKYWMLGPTNEASTWTSSGRENRPKTDTSSRSTDGSETSY